MKNSNTGKLEITSRLDMMANTDPDRAVRFTAAYLVTSV